jgi:hypothetical protein
LKIIKSETSKPIKFYASLGRFETIQETTYEMSNVYIPLDYDQDNLINDIIIRMSGVASEIMLVDNNQTQIKQILANHDSEIIIQAINKIPEKYQNMFCDICDGSIDLKDNVMICKYPIDSPIWENAGGDKGRIEISLNKFPAPLKELIGNISWTIALQLIEINKSYIKHVVEDLNRMEPAIRNGDYYQSYYLGKEYINKLKIKISTN